jgi:hypothetical protein
MSSKLSNCFREANDVDYDGKIMVGNGHVTDIGNNIRALKSKGFYRVHEKFQQNPTLKIAVLIGIQSEMKSHEFLNELKQEIHRFGFDMQADSILSCDVNSFPDLERAFSRLTESEPDLILSMLPNKFVKEDGGVKGPYQATKHFTINRNVMNQNVREATVNNPDWKLSNIAVQILAKVGNIPWVIPKPLEFCDRILGADISREKKSNQKGTRNELGIPRWYASNGDLLNYRLVRTGVEGERIPFDVIREITPIGAFEKQRILFHGDGKRPRQEIDDFIKRGEELDGEIMVVEVIKDPPFRVYEETGKNAVGTPRKGDWIRISDSEAVLVSTLARHSTGTPQPLHIRCTPNITIEDAVKSVLQLSNLHYGSQQQPRCPITTHDAHHISKMLMMGVRPPGDEGTVPWWL